MTETTSHSPRPVTIVLLIAAALTVLLGIAIAFAYLSRPKPITLTITSPAGGVVLCDLVIDGRAEQHRDTVPVTYSDLAERFRFAVIPELAGAGNVEIDLSSSHGGGTISGPGVTGECQANAWGSSSRVAVMTGKHIANMRAARLTVTRPEVAGNGTSSKQQRSKSGSPVNSDSGPAGASP